VWLSVVDGIDGALAGVYERDFPRAAALLHSAADSARTVGMFDAALLSEAQLGLVLVLSGAVSDGLRLLDGATTAAVSGEIGDPSSAVAVCCLLTAACLSIRDLARAAEWSQYAWDLAADRGEGRCSTIPGPIGRRCGFCRVIGQERSRICATSSRAPRAGPGRRPWPVCIWRIYPDGADGSSRHRHCWPRSACHRAAVPSVP
jgi:hypothetical protein